MKALKEIPFFRNSVQHGRRASGRRTLFTVIGVVLLSLMIAGIAYAFSLGNVDGVWSRVDTNGAYCDGWATGPGDFPTNYSADYRSIQTPPNTDENQVRYGEPVNDDCPGGFDWQNEFGKQSGFGFDGNNGPLTPAAGTPFYLGKFTHYNNPIYTNDTAFSYVDLAVSVPVTCNDDVTTTSFSFTPRMALEETPNQAGTCAYPGSTICPDKVTVTQPTMAQTFTCPDGTYTVNIQGFTTSGLNGEACDQSFNPASVSDEFITEEQFDNVACLWAAIEEPAELTVNKIINSYNAGAPDNGTFTLLVDDAASATVTDVNLPFPDVDGSTGVLSILPGMHTISEEAGPLPITLGQYETNLTCIVGEDTFDYGAVTTWDLEILPGESWVCTFTNVRKPPTAVTFAGASATFMDGSVLVTWDTALEIDLLGFNVYRSDTVEGVKSKLNSTLIESQMPGGIGGASYEFVDASVQRGTTYYYWLQLEETTGTTFTEPLEVATYYYLRLPVIVR